MFDLPPVPKAFVTRHLPCVSCKEKFVISEGSEERRREISPITPTVNVRFEDDRQQLQVLPAAHSAHQPTSSTLSTNVLPGHDVINCPRCGADNRNWFYLNNYPHRELLGSRLLGSWEIWLQRMPGIMLLAIMSIALFVLMLLFAVFNIMSKTHSLVLAFAIPLTVCGVYWDLTHKWKKYREDKLLYEYKLTSRNPALILQLRGIFMILFFSMIVPFLFVSLLPRGLDFAAAIVTEAPEESVNKTISNISELTNERLEESKESLQIIAAEMRLLLSRMPANTSPQFESELDTFSRELDTVVTDATKALDVTLSDGTEALAAQRDAEMGAITEATEAAIRDFREKFLDEVRYLVIWGGLLGGATLMAVIFAFANLTKFISRINAHLPLPIYHSVAGMTRLVTWEAKRALEIKGNMQHIQWMFVNRNEAGGINLEGLYREPPEFDMYGRPKKEEVRAQKHIIKTDHWGRIVEAEIKDIMVPIPAGAPNVIPVFTEPLPHDAQRIRLSAPSSASYTP